MGEKQTNTTDIDVGNLTLLGHAQFSKMVEYLCVGGAPDGPEREKETRDGPSSLE